MASTSEAEQEPPTLPSDSTNIQFDEGGDFNGLQSIADQFAQFLEEDVDAAPAPATFPSEIHVKIGELFDFSNTH